VRRDAGEHRQISGFQFRFFVKFIEESGMLKKAAALLLVCASVVICVSCGTTATRYLYAAIPNSNELVVYREDPNSGALTQLVGSPIAAGPGVRALALHPNQKFLYAANSGENDVSLFIVSSTGGLTEKTPRTAVGTAPTLIAMDSAGTYLFVGNTGQQPSISVFSIDKTTGALSPVIQPPSTGNTAYIGLTPINMAVSSNNVLYVTGQGLQGYVAAFPLSNGVLGTPPPQAPYLTGNNPYGLAISSNGSFLYTANKLDDSVSEFSIASNGGLTALTGSPVSISFTGPTALLIDPSGKYLYAADQGSTNLEGFTIGSKDGSLNLLPSAPFATGSQPSTLACDSAGRYLFVGNQSSPSIQSFFLAPGTGTLTLISTYSIAPGAPTSMVLTK
jgi:6-phosphogluconolactonase